MIAPLLLDTPVLLWWLTDDRRLAWTTRNRIARPSEAGFVSVATAWEISSLARQGVVDFGAPVAEWLPHEVAVHRFVWLALECRHVLRAQTLPRNRLDPDDRLIVAQASLEGLLLVTTNAAMKLPGIDVLDAEERVVRDSTPPRSRQERPAPATKLGGEAEASRSRESSPDETEDMGPLPGWNALPWTRD